MTYRNIYYNSKQKNIHLWTWDENGNRIEKIDKFEPYIYLECVESEHNAISIFDTYLKKYSFKNEYERRQFVTNTPSKKIFYNISPTQQYLIDNFYRKNDTEEFSKNKLKIFFLDIEVFSPNEFPEELDAKHPINLITVYDTLLDVYNSFGLANDFKPVKPNHNYYKFNTEKELLQSFLAYWSSDYPDIVSGWNSIFDISYIVNRIYRVLDDGNPSKLQYEQENFIFIEGYNAKMLSPVNYIMSKISTTNRYKRIKVLFDIRGITHIDYMVAYKKFSRSEKDSYTLDNIAKEELNIGKIEYNATNLAKLSDTDWNKFVEYNVRDVELLILLEDKLNFLKIIKMLAYKGLSEFEDSLGTISIVTGLIATQAKRNGKIILTNRKSEKKNDYSGGFVKEIEPSITSSIVTFDANSLYPNILITLNLSPETKIGKIQNINKEDKKITIFTVTGKSRTLSYDVFMDFVKKEKISISKSKILFSQKKKGILPETLDTIYNERVKTKNKIDKLERKKEKSIKDIEDIKRLDIVQYTLKIFMNSIYGALGNVTFPMFDIDCATSITLTGQSIIKEASNIINSYVKEKYSITEDVDVYNDTDSIHFTITPILNKYNYTMLDSNNKINNYVYDIAFDIQNNLNTKIKEWCENDLNSLDCRIFFKRESICSNVIYESKKHYIMHILDKGEDLPLQCDKMKYVGVEVVKSTMSIEVKNLIKKVIENIIKCNDKNKAYDIYLNAYEEFKKLAIEEIAFRSNINNFEKYSKNVIGFQTKKGTPVHVKSSIYYNQLLNNFNLHTKYNLIQSGNKIKWFYCGDNKYALSTLAFTGKFPEEFKSLFKIDYEKMFKNSVAKPIDRIYNCIKWNKVDVQNRVHTDLLTLFG